MPYPVGSEQKLSTEDPRMGKFLSLKHKIKHCSISDGILLSAACQWNIADSHTSFFHKVSQSLAHLLRGTVPNKSPGVHLQAQKYVFYYFL